MKRLLKIAVGALVVLTLWAALVIVGGRNGWLRPMPAAKGDTAAFLNWAQEKYASESQGNIAIILLENGLVEQTYFASPGRAVEGDSLFQIASISKWVTAWGVMTLAEQDLIDLDAPVSRYLTRWQLPPGSFNNEEVTVRRLLSHTAGLTDGLGFLGFEEGQPLPTLEEELTQPRDVMPGTNGIVQVGAQPGSAWRYSGGGYLILQLLIEDVTQEPFNAYMQRAVLQPLGMTGSTFLDPDVSRLVDFYSAGGSPATHYRFTATGAASLYTSATDLTRFLQAHLDSPEGAPPGRGVLSPAMLEEMQTPEAFLYGLPVWGLGPTLYAPNGAEGYVIGHDGGNYPAINTTARIDPATGNGIVVLQTGSATLAREIGGEWLYWQTGKVGLDTLVVLEARNILITFASGTILILIGAIVIARTGRSRQPRSASTV